MSGADGAVHAEEADAVKMLSGEKSAGHDAKFVSTNHAISPAGTSAESRAVLEVPMTCAAPPFTDAHTLYAIARSAGVQMNCTFVGTSLSPSPGEMRSGELMSHSGL